jgi:hypothetical protein
MWRISVTDAGMFTINTSDAELLGGEDYPHFKVLADAIAFCEHLESEATNAVGLTLQELYAAVKPFASIVHNSNGRVPTEQLSLADWHKLTKAFDAAKTLLFLRGLEE